MECFGREQDAAELWKCFEAGDNVLMLAPRRIGKTVLMNHLVATAAANGYRAILLNVEGLQEEKEFFRECCAAIQEELSTGKKVMTALSQRLSQVLLGSNSADWRTALLQSDWQEFANHLFAHLDHPEEETRPWLLLVDELPVFVQALHQRGGAQAMSRFLYWLRNMRQKHRNVRWLYAGSIGLDTVARRTNVEGALNDLRPYTLRPFSVTTAKAFLVHIAAKRATSFESEALDMIVVRLGWLSPRYLYVVADDALSIADTRPVDCNAANEAMDRLLDLDKRLYWSAWREHIDRNFVEPDRTHLHNALEVIAKDASGVTEDTLQAALPALTRHQLRAVLDVLVNDGFVDAGTDHRYRFRMNLLREWWLRYVVL
jgi:uncharacterized protein